MKSLGRMRAGLRRYLRRDDGVSAVEFALLAPVLFFAGVAMIDVGMGLGQRMEMDRLLRSGAQHAMDDPGADAVRNRIIATAPDDLVPGEDFTLTVRRYCACPLVADVEVGCSTLCDAVVVPAIYYRLQAETTRVGLMLPETALTTSAEVRIR